jgi:hypothetical protein
VRITAQSTKNKASRFMNASLLITHNAPYLVFSIAREMVRMFRIA